MVDSVQDKRTKHVIETLEKQYKTEKYGKLHRSLFKHGIRTELYIGDGIEMYYPYAVSYTHLTLPTNREV